MARIIEHVADHLKTRIGRVIERDADHADDQNGTRITRMMATERKIMKAWVVSLS